MDHTWNEIIPSAVVPVVIISACGLLCLAFYNRLAAIIARLRSLQRERLGEYKALFHLEEVKASRLSRHESELTLRFLEEQTAQVMKKAHYMRACITCFLAAIGSLIFCSLAIGLSLFYHSLDWMVLFFFVAGLGLIMVGLNYALLEIRLSLTPLQMECAFLQSLIKNPSQ